MSEGASDGSEGMSEGAEKPSGAEPVPIGGDGATAVGSCLAMFMGDAAAKAARPVMRIVMVCMILVVGIGLSGVVCSAGSCCS